MISEFIHSNSVNIHINCIGKKEIESNDLTEQSIPEIISFFTKENLKVMYLEQEHGTKFHEITSLSKLPLVGDAFYTTEKNIILVIKTADCIPIFFWSLAPLVIGAIHSGWRGTSKNITESICMKVIEKFQLKNLSFYIGPCIRKSQYEIDEDVARLFIEKYPQSLEKKGGKYLFGNDLVVKEQIRNLPVQVSIYDSEICNYLDTDYYSHRRKEFGRNINYIYIT